MISQMVMIPLVDVPNGDCTIMQHSDRNILKWSVSEWRTVTKHSAYYCIAASYTRFEEAAVRTVCTPGKVHTANTHYPFVGILI